MDKLKKIIPAIAFVSIAVITIFFRYQPKGQNWEEYHIIYVDKEAPAEKVHSILKEAGILESISLDGQRVPIMLTKNSPEETMLRLNLEKEENSYIFTRQNYFYDSQAQYLLYYIPQQYEAKLGQAIRLLQNQGYQAGADTALPYLWLLPVLVILLAILLGIFNLNKLTYFFMAIPSCIYISCNAFYAAAIAVIILLLCIFVIANLWGRRGAVKRILNNYFLIAAAFVSLIISFSTAFIPGLFFILNLIATLAAAYISQNLKGFKLRKSNFVPILIRPANKVSYYGAKAKVILPLVLISSVLVFAYFARGAFNLTGVESDSKILLPGKANQAEADPRLPDLEAFYRWNWNVLTSPYKSLNPNSEYDQAHVVFPRFHEEEGILVQTNQVMYYDEAFKKRVFDDIDKLDFNSIEALVKTQASDFTAAYTSSSSYKISLFSIIMMITGFFMLLFIYFSAMIGKGGRR